MTFKIAEQQQANEGGVLGVPLDNGLPKRIEEADVVLRVGVLIAQRGQNGQTLLGLLTNNRAIQIAFGPKMLVKNRFGNANRSREFSCGRSAESLFGENTAAQPG